MLAKNPPLLESHLLGFLLRFALLCLARGCLWLLRAVVITYTILGVPYYTYSIMGSYRHHQGTLRLQVEDYGGGASMVEGLAFLCPLGSLGRNLTGMTQRASQVTRRPWESVSDLSRKDHG